MLHLQLYSGGIDSYIGYLYLTHELGVNVQPIYFHLKHRYAFEEIQTILKVHPNTYILESFLNLGQVEAKNAHIPYRNIFLVLATASLHYFDNTPITIYINSMADDQVSDQGPKFIEQMNNLLEYHTNNKHIRLKSSMPLNWTKFDAVDWYLSKGFEKERLAYDTFSCYNPIDHKECLACKACFRKNTLLYYAGVKRPFYNRNLIEYYRRNAHRYPPKRAKAILSYIRYLDDSLGKEIR
jgi:7-cyano-7-deazaguanine synthase in queuosine biosynthesis